MATSGGSIAGWRVFRGRVPGIHVLNPHAVPKQVASVCARAPRIGRISIHGLMRRVRGHRFSMRRRSELVDLIVLRFGSPTGSVSEDLHDASTPTHHGQSRE